ncbi:acyl carrier protein [Paludifilum halophilum]|uniref:Acyl carrier protein n=1 Tax=Paludifilum halophilum TaxID=1642702 RepID=A0A235BB30_9BACL|nr:acyl carrier protein [Paludifilum halophilum]OYD09087.1 acyl carrier protein [Paludifilum halophilum]
MELQAKVRSYIENNLVVFEENVQFSDDDNIFERGFVNSLFAMKLLNYIEQDFGITVDNEDLDIANFSTVNNIVSLIEKKRSGVS